MHRYIDTMVILKNTSKHRRFLPNRLHWRLKLLSDFGLYLYELIKNAGKKDHGICFVSPSVIYKDGRLKDFVKGDEASRAIACRLQKRKDNHIILMPYNSGDHWVLAVLDMQTTTCYHLDSAGHGFVDTDFKRMIELAMSLYARESGSNEITLNWKNVVCPCQPGIRECGYYVLKFMKAIVDEGLEVLTNNFWGKVTYTDVELDMVREERCSYVTNFVY